MADRELDPRFDPRYQRGFDPAVHDSDDARRSSLARPAPVRSDMVRSEYARPGSASVETSDPRQSSLFSPAKPDSPQRPVGSEAVQPTLRFHEPRGRGQGDADAAPVSPFDDEVIDDDLDFPARNPYRVALLVGSLASLLVGLVALWATANVQGDIYSRQDTVAIFVLSVANALAPALISGAVIGAVMWIALGAVLPRVARDD